MGCYTKGNRIAKWEDISFSRLLKYQIQLLAYLWYLMDVTDEKQEFISAPATYESTILRNDTSNNRASCLNELVTGLMTIAIIGIL